MKCKKAAKGEGGRRHSSSDDEKGGGVKSVIVREYGHTKGGVELNLDNFDDIDELIREAAKELDIARPGALLREDEVKITDLKLIKKGATLYLKSK